jgi:putative phage-type endonuclease
MEKCQEQTGVSSGVIEEQTGVGVIVERNSSDYPEILSNIDEIIKGMEEDFFHLDDFRELLQLLNITIQSIHNINILDEIRIIEHVIENHAKHIDIQHFYPPKIRELQLIPQPAQKSKEWLDRRQNFITASVFGDACGIKGVRSLVTLLLNKISYDQYQPFMGNTATKWGEKYEPVANMIYCHRNMTKIYDFGLIPHKKEDLYFLGASTDGATHDLINIEIKCPYSRLITGVPPTAYWAQMQLQMEVLDLDKTHFLECSFMEYNNIDGFFEDFYLDTEQMNLRPESDDQIKFRRETVKEKGLIIETKAEELKDKYIYSSISDLDTLRKWYQTTKENLGDKYLTTHPWVLTRLSCVNVDRDKEWFESSIPVIKTFWKDVEYYREKKTTLGELGRLKEELTEKYSKLLGVKARKSPNKKSTGGGLQRGVCLL